MSTRTDTLFPYTPLFRAALAELAQARDGTGDGPPGLDTGLGIAEQAIRNGAQARIRVLERRKADGAPASTASAESASAEVDGTAGATPGKNVDKEAGANSSEASPTGDDADTDTRTASEDEETHSINGEPWAPASNPLTASWWPDFANRWLNAPVGRGKIGRAAWRERVWKYGEISVG